MEGPQGFGEALLAASMYPVYPPHVIVAIALLLHDDRDFAPVVEHLGLIVA